MDHYNLRRTAARALRPDGRTSLVTILPTEALVPRQGVSMAAVQELIDGTRPPTFSYCQLVEHELRPSPAPVVIII